MKRLLTGVILFLFLPILSWSQHEDCGTEVTPEQYNYLSQFSEARSNFSINSRTDEYHVPVKIHVLKKDDGTGGLSDQVIFNEMDKLNDIYRGANLHFFVCGPFNYINDTRFYDFNQSDENSLANSNDQANAINIYFVNSLKNSYGTELCGYSYLPQGRDRVFIHNSCAPNGATIAHEIGHYFSLYHTHGIGSNPYELVNGTNCDIAADEACDTPADPKLTNLVNSSCQYTGTIKDTEGNSYNPDTRNIMSYAPSYCRSSFSQEQLNRVLFSYLNNRNYLSCSDTFYTGVIPSVEKPSAEFSMFPNPTTGNFAINLEEGMNKNLHVKIYDMFGNEVYAAKEENGLFANSLQIDMSGKGKGMYFVNVESENKVISKKLIYQ